MLAVEAVFPNLIGQVLCVSYNGALSMTFACDDAVPEPQALGRLYLDELCRLAEACGAPLESPAELLLHGASALHEPPPPDPPEPPPESPPGGSKGGGSARGGGRGGGGHGGGRAAGAKPPTLPPPPPVSGAGGEMI